MDGNDWSLAIMRATPPATLQIIAPAIFNDGRKLSQRVESCQNGHSDGIVGSLYLIG
jgi:hypothetical protein